MTQSDPTREDWRPAMCPDPTGCSPLIHPTTDPDNMGPGFAERGFAVFCWGRLAAPLVWTFDDVEHVETLSSCQSSPLKGVVRWLENESDWSALIRGYRAAITAASDRSTPMTPAPSLVSHSIDCRRCYHGEEPGCCAEAAAAALSTPPQPSLDE